MSNNKQPVELTEITVSSPVATQGLTMEDRDTSIGLLLDFAKRGRNRGERLPSICKVPSILRDLSVSSFIPQLVSIGPIHRKNEKLKEFEWLKGCYLDDLLSHCDSEPKETLQKCLQKVSDLIPKIRESYNAGVIENYSEVELATMMVTDGCFILEFCFKHQKINLYLPNKMQNMRIAMDLMLLENQVPFFVLQALFDCLPPYIFGEKGSVTLSNILDEYLAPYIKLFCSRLPENISIIDVDPHSTPAHVLGYLHKRYNHVAAKSWNPVDAEAFHGHTIVELNRSGINFKPHQQDVWSMTIKFQSPPFLPGLWDNPTLQMPTLVIDDFTELILRNFIAYEQSFLTDRYYFTSYAHAMDKLIDSKEDIAKLVESKVLVNNLGSNQEAADMINKICKNISNTDFCYTQAFKQMDWYYNAFWTKRLAPLRRVLRDDPWSYSNIFLLYLTVIQTFYTIKAA